MTGEILQLSMNRWEILPPDRVCTMVSHVTTHLQSGNLMVLGLTAQTGAQVTNTWQGTVRPPTVGSQMDRCHNGIGNIFIWSIYISCF